MSHLHKKKVFTVIIIILAMFIFVLLLGLPEILGLYNKMIGHECLKRIISAIIVKDLVILTGVIPLLILAIMILKQNKTESLFKRIFSAFLSTGIPVVFLMGMNITCFYEIEHINGHSTFADIGNLKLLVGCISDYSSDDYIEYTAATVDFEITSHLSLLPIKSPPTYHNEYTVSFYSNADHLPEHLITKSQIGKDEYIYYSQHLPCDRDINFSVYKKSGLIRSMEPSDDHFGQECYWEAYNIQYQNQNATFEIKSDAYKTNELYWCTFGDRNNNDIRKAIYAVDAINRPVLENPFQYIDINQICLYGYVNGEFRRVSNIIYRDEIS